MELSKGTAGKVRGASMIVEMSTLTTAAAGKTKGEDQ
jgi:hypothetical protein